MAYYIDLFSPDTYGPFSDSNRDISGVSEKRKRIAANIKPGDIFICYMTKLSRWVGVLEVSSNYFMDDRPIFRPSNDPYIIRFHVESKVWLEPECSVPINQDICWNYLSFTKNLPRNCKSWTSMVRRSLIKLPEEDGRYLEALLTAQGQELQRYPLTDAEKRRLSPSVINSEAGPIAVSIPDEENTHANRRGTETEHTRIQAALAKIGESMGFRIWLPKADRQRVLEIWRPVDDHIVLTHLPLNYDTVTLRTIENIDVLWIRRNAIIRAFEVEHSTSIYSGLLRMADLLSLQPNLDIKAHIVAPLARCSKVLQEISRPVFALMGRKPMSEWCSYLSYDAIRELSGERNLSHMNDSVWDDYAVYAQESEF